jgi:hypothetical protein
LLLLLLVLAQLLLVLAQLPHPAPLRLMMIPP